jgi:hypothetical protein
VNSQAWTLFLTQWRIVVNFYRRYGRTSFILSLLFSAIWYGGFAGIAVFAARFAADPDNLDRLRRALPIALFFAFAYWQGMPLLMASVGGMLDFKKLLVYPIAERDLFRIEMLLRTAMFCEMPIVMLGLMVGILRNPALPKWCVFGPALFAVFNIALGAGLRDLISRWFQKKRVRELAILAVVLLAALPSWLANERGAAIQLLSRFRDVPKFWLPWLSASEASLNENGWRHGPPWLRCRSGRGPSAAGSFTRISALTRLPSVPPTPQREAASSTVCWRGRALCSGIRWARWSRRKSAS